MSRRTRKPNQFELLHRSAHTQRQAAIARETRRYLDTILCGLGRMITKADPNYSFASWVHNAKPTLSFSDLGTREGKSFQLSHERSDGTTKIYRLKGITTGGKEDPNCPITLAPMEDGEFSPRTIEEMARVMAKSLGVDLTAQAKQPAPPAKTMNADAVEISAPHP